MTHAAPIGKNFKTLYFTAVGYSVFFDTSLLLWYNYLYGKIVRRDIYRKEFVWYSKKKNIFGWRQ